LTGVFCNAEKQQNFPAKTDGLAMLHGVKVYGAEDPLRWDLHERLTTNEPVVPVGS